MDLNKFAEETYNAAFRDEMHKLAQENGETDSYVPAAVSLAALPFMVNKGSILGRKAGLKSVPIADWLFQASNPNIGIPTFARRAVGARSVLSNTGTLAGALTGALGAAYLYDKLKDKW
jgi:hypothetical protein